MSSLLTRRPPGGIALAFHDVVEDRALAAPIAPGHTTLYTLDRRTFRDHLNTIRSSVGPGAVRRVDESAAEGSILLTFDDGALGSYTCVAPELESLSWRGHFFITTNWVGQGGFVSASQIRELHQRGHAIGSHSCEHPLRMSDLSWDDLVREWADSCARLADITGRAVKLASVPGGYYSRRVAGAAASAGIEVLFTSEPTAHADSVDGCRVLGRYSIRHRTSARLFAAIASGNKWAHGAQSAAWLVKKAAKGIAGPRYESLRCVLLKDGAGVHRDAQVRSG